MFMIKGYANPEDAIGLDLLKKTKYTCMTKTGSKKCIIPFLNICSQAKYNKKVWKVSLEIKMHMSRRNRKQKLTTE